MRILSEIFMYGTCFIFNQFDISPRHHWATCSISKVTDTPLYTSKTPYPETQQNRHWLDPKNARHDIPGQRLVSGQQFPGNIGAIDPSGQLVALHASRSHPTKLSLMDSQLEMVWSQGRKLTADPLILVCTTSACVRLPPRRAIKVTLIIMLLFVLSFQLQRV